MSTVLLALTLYLKGLLRNLICFLVNVIIESLLRFFPGEIKPGISYNRLGLFLSSFLSVNGEGVLMMSLEKCRFIAEKVFSRYCPCWITASLLGRGIEQTPE